MFCGSYLILLFYYSITFLECFGKADIKYVKPSNPELGGFDFDVVFVLFFFFFLCFFPSKESSELPK